MTDFESHKNFLMAVLNEALMHDRTDIVVRSDLLEIDLFRLDYSRNRIAKIADQHRFNSRLSELRRMLGDEFLEHELPDYYDLRDAMQSSMLLPPENLSELMDELLDMERRKRDPYRFPKQKMLAIDTNVAYNRLLSRMTLLMNGGPLGRVNPSSVPIIIPSLVEEEISNMVGRKYRPNDLRRLKEDLGRGEANCYVNCLIKSGRKAMNAQTEIKLIRELYSARGIRGGEFLEDKEARDEEMVRIISDFSSGQRCEVLFLSADDKARAHAYSQRIPAVKLEYPWEIPSQMEVDPWLLVEFLYDLSISFGLLSFKGLGVRVQGVWAGKSADDYLGERLKFQVEKGSVLAEDLERDHRVLGKLCEAVDMTMII
jgi:hypothetical protein